MVISPFDTGHRQYEEVGEIEVHNYGWVDDIYEEIGPRHSQLLLTDMATARADLTASNETFLDHSAGLRTLGLNESVYEVMSMLPRKASAMAKKASTSSSRQVDNFAGLEMLGPNVLNESVYEPMSAISRKASAKGASAAASRPGEGNDYVDMQTYQRLDTIMEVTEPSSGHQSSWEDSSVHYINVPIGNISTVEPLSLPEGHYEVINGKHENFYEPIGDGLAMPPLTTAAVREACADRSSSPSRGSSGYGSATWSNVAQNASNADLDTIYSAEFGFPKIACALDIDSERRCVVGTAKAARAVEKKKKKKKLSFKVKVIFFSHCEKSI